MLVMLGSSLVSLRGRKMALYGYLRHPIRESILTVARTITDQDRRYLRSDVVAVVCLVVHTREEPRLLCG